MSQNLFLCSASVQPSARWREAFPDGVCCDWTQLLAAAQPRDVVWLAAAHSDWQAVLARAGKALPDCPVVVLSRVPQSDEAVVALDLGARGYCDARPGSMLLREVALVVRHGGLWIGPELLTRVLSAAGRALGRRDALRPPKLSPREAEVAREVAAGLSNKEIAAKLGITERTVKAHLSAIFEKLGVRDRLQLVLRLAGRNDGAA